MTKGIVISLYDFTGEALKPWAEAEHPRWPEYIAPRGFAKAVYEFNSQPVEEMA